MENSKEQKIWNEVLDSIKVSVSAPTFNTWFKQTHLQSIEETDGKYLIQVGCETSFAKATVESRYSVLIQDALTKSLGKSCNVTFIVKPNPIANQNDNQQANSPLFSSEMVPQHTERTVNYSSAKIRSNFTFDNFAVSSSNQMAFAAAQAVSGNPGSAYNPLFIWGGVGVGKTHLMNAIGHTLLKKKDDVKMLFCTGEDFTNDIVDGIRKKTTNLVRSKYRQLDALFLDDVQFLAGKDTIQEEFFHTFNTLVSSGSQITLTSDRPPSEISKLEERLRSRFEAGLIVDISEPDFELRCAITQIKSQEKSINLDMDLVQLIAGNVYSAREVEGVLMKITSEINLKNMILDRELIEKILNKGDTKNMSKSNLKATPNDVMMAVSNYYRIGKRQITGSSRTRTIVVPRQILMYVLRKELGLAYEEIGEFIGGRDHTTVMHAVDKITSLASRDVQTREDIRGILNII